MAFLRFVILGFFFVSTLCDNKNYVKMIRKKPHPSWSPYIICQTCKETMKTLNRHVRQYKKVLTKKQLSNEDTYYNITRDICNPYRDLGEWITMYDLVKEKNKLKLTYIGEFGRCQRECETIAYTCYEKIVWALQNEITELLLKGASLSKLQNKICKKACKKESKLKSNTDNDGNIFGYEKHLKYSGDAEFQRKMFKSFVSGEEYKMENPDPKDVEMDDYENQVRDWIDRDHNEKEHIKKEQERQERLRKKGIIKDDETRMYHEDNDPKYDL